MKANYPRAGSQIHIKHDVVYARIEQNQQFVTDDMVNYANANYDQAEDMISQMSGHGNTALFTDLQLLRMKAATLSNGLSRILQFIYMATKEMEAEDRALGKHISSGNGRGNNG